MRVPLSWLRELTPVEASATEVAATLDDLGLVVDSLETVDAGLEGVVVARIAGIEPIDGADRIRKVTVDRGAAAPVEVVCGAWNIAVGELVPLATPGTVLPNGMAIQRRKMRGVTSEGMLCSATELGLGDDAAGILVLDGVAGAAEGAPLVEALSLAGDAVFDVSVEGNRPDGLSVAGVARDLAGRLNLPFRLPEPSVVEAGPPAAELAAVTVAAPHLCPRFTGRVLTNVTPGASPPWMARRLILAGMRPINAVVDISNYVMLELGQPNHPYDLDLLAKRTIRVREAGEGETIETLDGQVRRLGVADRRVAGGAKAHDCLICDGDDTPIGVAGIMGGATTEIRDETTAVLLETAYFDPMAIARTAKRTGMRTEASVRFERGCDPAGIERAAARFCELAVSICGPGVTVAPGILDVAHDVPAPVHVAVRTARVNAILGTDLTDGDVAGYLAPIGFTCTPSSPGVMDVEVPTFRPDAGREIDVIEEVARHHGLSRIARTRPAVALAGRLSAAQMLRRRIREIVAGAGADEAWTPSLVGPGDHVRAGITGADVRIANPLAREQSILRRSLLPGLLAAVAFNVARRQDWLRLFEVGRVFQALDDDSARPDEGSCQGRSAGERGRPRESERLGVVLAWSDDGSPAAMRLWRTAEEALGIEGVAVVAAGIDGDVAGDVLVAGLHPARSALLVDTARARAIGAVGEVDPDVAGAYGLGGGRRIGWLDLDLDLVLGVGRRSVEVRLPSRFPSSDIDLAFEVDESVPAAAVEATLASAAGSLLISVRLFDVYRGPAVQAGTRGLAWRLRFCADDHTLTDAEVSAVRTHCIEAVEGAHRARLRA